MEALLISFLHIFVIFFFRRQPKTPPSFVSVAKREDFMISVKQLFRSEIYRKLFFAYGLIIGSVQGLVNVLAFILQPYAFGTSDVSYFSVCVIIFGIIGSVSLGFYFKRRKRFRTFIKYSGVASALIIFLNIGTLSSEKLFALLIGACLMGYFYSPLVPAIYEYACESVYPIGEGNAVGFLVAGGAIFSIIYLAIFSLFFDKEEETSNYKYESVIVLCIAGASILLGIIIIHFTKEQHKREEAERRIRLTRMRTTQNEKKFE